MKIGVHKLGFDSIDSISGVDKNGMFTEVMSLISIFSEHGYDVEYVNTVGSKNNFDIIYVFNGIENRTSCLNNLKNICNELNYILTDSRFYKTSYESTRNENLFVDNYFVQSPVKMYSKPTFNSQLQRLPIYQRYQYKIKASNIRKEKIIFGGSVRDRRDKFFEYILRPEVDYFINFKDLEIDTRITLKEYNNLLNKYKYGIVLLNPKDVEIGNITWRYYEYIANRVCAFIDINSDKNNLLLKKGDYRYVKNYEQLVYKINELNRNEHLYNLILSNQSSMISHSDITGETFVKSLLEKRNENV